jgi:hypothetical protein
MILCWKLIAVALFLLSFDIQMIRELIYIFGGFVEYSFFFVGFKVILLTCCLFLSLRDSWNG